VPAQELQSSTATAVGGDSWPPSSHMRIGIVAGEASGDLLGAGLIAAIRERVPEALFEGIGGPQMVAQGCLSLVPADRLAVMGLFEVLAHLPELLRIRSRLLRSFLSHPPDVFVGIDSPDFTLPLEHALKRQGVRTVHYVSPSVWAWRRGRVRKIAQAVDMMLTLLPFEADFYREHRVPVRFVGHPLADRIPPVTDSAASRAILGVPEGSTVVAMLPGSRINEVRYLAPPFLETAAWLHRRRPDLHFVVPLVSPRTVEAFERVWRRLGSGLPISVVQDASMHAMIAAEVVLTASGTATLEAMLLGRPMVVAYRMSPQTYLLAKRLVKVPHIALPNLLAGGTLVPELIQHAVTAETLGAAVLHWLQAPQARRQLVQAFSHLRASLQKGADA
jgi:lipid-A-disaccharide synthase